MQLISEAMNAKMNEQVGHEMGASMRYVNMAAYFESAGLPVLAKHFMRQADEERQHAMKFVRYIMDADGAVRIPAIPAPEYEFASAEQAVSTALEWEFAVTRQINELLELATREHDYLAHDFLEWFAREQLEECSSMDTLRKMVKRTGEAGLMLVENAIASGQALGTESAAES